MERRAGRRPIVAAPYALDYDLDLISNFSYFIDPDRGDQFQQIDQRRVYGGDWSWGRPGAWLGLEHGFAAGVQVRYDDIDEVGLHRTVAGERFETIRQDAVRQTSYGVYGSLDTRWADFVRTTVGLRADRFD